MKRKRREEARRDRPVNQRIQTLLSFQQETIEASLSIFLPVDLGHLVYVYVLVHPDKVALDPVRYWTLVCPPERDLCSLVASKLETKLMMSGSRNLMTRQVLQDFSWAHLQWVMTKAHPVTWARLLLFMALHQWTEPALAMIGHLCLKADGSLRKDWSNWSRFLIHVIPLLSPSVPSP